MAATYLIIGCGNMGGAMLAGWLAAGIPAERFAIRDPALEAAPEGVALYRSAQEVPGTHDAVLLGFKPQQLGALAPGLQGLAGESVAVHYLLAGLTLGQICEAFPKARAYIRVMPNLAARLGKSPILLAQSGLEAAQSGDVHAFYDTLGTAVWLEDESRFDLLTALAGSGPGFVYRFIDALAQAATRLGAQPDQASQLALAMVDGASSLAAGAEMSPGVLADAVASPGGMTREGLNVLDSDEALVSLLSRTLEATASRGTALS
ncbi:MAG: pyrroline-5-carboxylate reductase dimerization domain-containing protein, partial [Pseudomonadota bacterium]